MLRDSDLQPLQAEVRGLGQWDPRTANPLGGPASGHIGK